MESSVDWQELDERYGPPGQLFMNQAAIAVRRAAAEEQEREDETYLSFPPAWDSND